ncbi:DUF7344 domain-containing protein [Halorussus amylolyticus]|uniref:DUF7344 domain-containing protein n=1 Tax=Halorussus amylolyticus TaxID=1126242 RepID=UPI0010470128|nr:hypothetical protein [Halorussus amylolyticus]
MCDDTARGRGDDYEAGSGSRSEDDEDPSRETIPKPPDDPHLSLDTLFEMLSKPRCRLTLAYLEDMSGKTVELDDIVAYVTEHETEEKRGDTDPEQHRQQVAATLHHQHLPRLSDAAILDYDPRSKSVRYWGNDRVAAYLERIRSDEEE